MALNRMVFALTFHLLSLNLFPLALLAFSVGHFFLALTLNYLSLPGVPFAFMIQGLWGCMLHSLPDTRKGVCRYMRGSRRMLTVGWRLMGSAVALA